MIFWSNRNQRLYSPSNVYQRTCLFKKFESFHYQYSTICERAEILFKERLVYIGLHAGDLTVLASRLESTTAEPWTPAASALTPTPLETTSSPDNTVSSLSRPW